MHSPSIICTAKRPLWKIREHFCSNELTLGVWLHIYTCMLYKYIGGARNLDVLAGDGKGMVHL